jgi:hypothetical protein
VAADRFDAARRGATLETIGNLIRRHYVCPDVVPAVVERLEIGARTGRYDVQDPGVFAELVGVDLRESASDSHLGLRYDPKANVALRAPGRPPGEVDDLTRRQALRIHHGLVEQRLLAANVRYLRITDFDWIPDSTSVAYDAAVRFLSEADAIIIDLRGNVGGEPLAVQYLVSHFLEPDMPVMTFLEAAATTTVRSLPHLPAGRLLGTPLFVLIDGQTYSAGEAFAYHVRHFGLGDLVGVATAGAAHVNERLPVGTEFVLSVSYGRPVHPATGTSWEGVGVPPTIVARPAEALDVAHAVALRRLAAGASSGELRAEYLWALAEVEARRVPPPRADPATLAAQAGTYGSAEVVLREGRLWLLRPARRDCLLFPLTVDGLYGVEGNPRLRVRLEPGRMLLYPGAAQRAQEYPRVVPADSPED